MFASCVAILLFVQTTLRDGTYRVAVIAPGAKVAVEQPVGTPPGAIRHVVVDRDYWILFDMMVGFDGPVKRSGRIVTFVVLNGPAGKLKKPDRIVFDLSQDGRVLTQVSRDRKMSRLVLTWTSAKLLVNPRHP